MFGDCVNILPANYQQFLSCLSCSAVGLVYHELFRLHIFSFMIYTLNKTFQVIMLLTCVRELCGLFNDKDPNYTDWNVNLIYLVPPQKYWNSTANWAKIISFSFVPVHYSLPLIQLTIVHMITYNSNCFNPLTRSSSASGYLQGDKTHY
jgi:hypothetical protein